MIIEGLFEGLQPEDIHGMMIGDPNDPLDINPFEGLNVRAMAAYQDEHGHPVPLSEINKFRLEVNKNYL